MPISAELAGEHIATWSRRLRPFPARAGWAEHLFHSCQLEVAISILNDGELRCRTQAGTLICDVANQGAVWNNPAAHNFARLYFRPRNSFHLKTEGIKLRSDPYRRDPHMSIPVMFAFDLEKVLTWRHAYFLAGNFARAAAAPQTGDVAFRALDFAKIYHDGPTTAENRVEIHDARMAEVVADHAIPVSMAKSVICRTPHELATLKAGLGKRLGKPPIVVEKQNSLFMRRQIYISEIFCERGHIHISITTSVHAGSAPVSYRIYSSESEQSGFLPSSRVRFNGFKAVDPNTVWTVELEGCVAYRAPIPWSDQLV